MKNPKVKIQKMEAQAMIQAELKRRMDLINDPQFRQDAATMCSELGISSHEWRENKAGILMFIANQVCTMENASQLEEQIQEDIKLLEEQDLQNGF